MKIKNNIISLNYRFLKEVQFNLNKFAHPFIKKKIFKIELLNKIIKFLVYKKFKAYHCMIIDLVYNVCVTKKFKNKFFYTVFFIFFLNLHINDQKLNI